MKTLKNFYQKRQKPPSICRACGSHHFAHSFYCTDCRNLAATFALTKTLRERRRVEQ
ncbi:hypothetical protein [Methylotuvimicrobium sp. KM1]|uniref:hypothetical protein n=1 Tax=Methylotuvimicrobium sp. KM1 TaxID=3377707 RepID=UPI00384ADCEC